MHYAHMLSSILGVVAENNSHDPYVTASFSYFYIKCFGDDTILNYLLGFIFRSKEEILIIIIGSTLKKGKIYPKFQCWKAPDRCSVPAQ